MAPDFSFYVLESAAIPGWTAGPLNELGGDSYIGYDTVSLGGAAVFLEDTSNNFGGLVPLQGRYSFLLEGSTAGGPGAAAIWQTGQIPSDARSLTFFLSLNSNLQVTFNGQLLSLDQIGSTSSYDIMGADISAFAGQTGQLQFTAPPNTGYGLLDNIQFSVVPVPEPSTLSLFGICILFLCWRMKQISAPDSN